MYTIISQSYIQRLNMIFLIIWIVLFAIIMHILTCRITDKINIYIRSAMVVIITVIAVIVPCILLENSIFTVDTENVKYIIKVVDSNLIELLSDYEIEGCNGDGVFTIVGKDKLK